jgi:hypothetical protein
MPMISIVMGEFGTVADQNLGVLGIGRRAASAAQELYATITEQSSRTRPLRLSNPRQSSLSFGSALTLYEPSIDRVIVVSLYYWQRLVT